MRKTVIVKCAENVKTTIYLYYNLDFYIVLVPLCRYVCVCVCVRALKRESLSFAAQVNVTTIAIVINASHG